VTNWIDTIHDLKKSKKSFGLITLVKVIGSAPQEIGARAIVTSEGLVFGTIGGGKVEDRAIKLAQSMIQNHHSFNFVEWNLQTDIGMTCGGVVSFCFEVETYASQFKVAVFGAGHVANEVIKLLVNLNTELKCIDPRSEWLDRLPKSNRLTLIQTNKMEQEISKLAPNTFIVSLTMGHSFDRPILAEALKLDFPFVGVIGSEQKANVLKKELKSIDKISDKKIETLICPIGEKIGTNDPAEIAISIVAQLLRVRDSYFIPNE
jgi:xanthine dehydrogenase accessory factor